MQQAGIDLYPQPLVQFNASAAASIARTENDDSDVSNSQSSRVVISASYTDILSRPIFYESEKARYDSLAASAVDVRLNTLVTTASVYFRILLLRDLLSAAEKNLGNAEAIEKIARVRVTAGVANEIELLQQQIAVQRQRNSLDSLRQDEYAASAALADLLAIAAQSLTILGRSLATINVPEVNAGVPAMLLVRRPDIVQAEADLRLNQAQVDLARVAFLPALGSTLRMEGGGNSLRFRDFSSTADVASQFTQLLLDNGARRRNLQRSELFLQDAFDRYKQTVIAAVNDVDVAIGNLALLGALADTAKEDLDRATESFRIARARYREGVADYQTVLIAQNSLFDAQNAVLNTKFGRLNGVLAMYQSLGGGWTSIN